MWGEALSGEGSLRPYCLPFFKFCRGHGAVGRVSLSGCAQPCPGQDGVWGRELHSPCAARAGRPGISHPSTMRLWALGGPRVAHTPGSPAHPPSPLCPEAGSENPPEELQGAGRVCREPCRVLRSPDVPPWCLLPPLPHSSLPALCSLTGVSGLFRAPPPRSPI